MFLLKRHEGGPILTPDNNLSWEREGVFNAGVIWSGNGAIMLYRAVGETEAYVSKFGLAKSNDGIIFERASAKPVFEPKESFNQWGAEDPRITKIGSDFYITYVAVPERVMLYGESFPRTTPLETSIALLKTGDFHTFENLGVISPKGSDNKDTVLFPKKINGRYCMLHRPSRWHKAWCDHLRANGEVTAWPCNTENLSENPGIWVSWSSDLKDWTDHKMLLHSSHLRDSKLGAGLPPIETKDGWLIVYHHVEFTENRESFIYSVRAALLDLNDPTRLIGELPYDILVPEMPYEKEKNSSIVFPTGGFIKDDKIFVYYGASDRYVCLATGSLPELLFELKQSNEGKK
jgi:predicted GH43/DUF377 family glycosyl hydrolase